LGHQVEAAGLEDPVQGVGVGAGAIVVPEGVAEGQHGGRPPQVGDDDPGHPQGRHGLAVQFIDREDGPQVEHVAGVEPPQPGEGDGHLERTPAAGRGRERLGLRPGVVAVGGGEGGVGRPLRVHLQADFVGRAEAEDGARLALQPVAGEGVDLPGPRRRQVDAHPPAGEHAPVGDHLQAQVDGVGVEAVVEAGQAGAGCRRVVGTGGVPFARRGDPVDLRGEEGGHRLDGRLRPFGDDRHVELVGDRVAQQLVDAHEGAAELPVEGGVVTGVLVGAVPPEPVRALGGVDLIHHLSQGNLVHLLQRGWPSGTPRPGSPPLRRSRW